MIPHHMNTITIYGPGCVRCAKLTELTHDIVREQQWDVTIVNVKDALGMAQAGVLSTPALAVNGELLFSGKVPGREALLELLLPILGSRLSQPACGCGADVRAEVRTVGSADAEGACGCGRACSCCRASSRAGWKKVLVWIVLVLLVLAAVKLANRYAAREGEEESAPAAASIVPASCAESASGAESAGVFADVSRGASADAACLRVVYYEFGARCSTCLCMEQWTREALEQNFATELARGQLRFSVLPADGDSARAYQLTTKAVILQTLVGGRETGWVNLDRIWALSGDEGAFKSYIAQGVREQLSHMQD